MARTNRRPPIGDAAVRIRMGPAHRRGSFSPTVAVFDVVAGSGCVEPGRGESGARPTITVPEIRALAGWDTSQPVVEVNLADNTERTLNEGETVTLKPGHGFAKKIKFQRG